MSTSLSDRSTDIPLNRQQTRVLAALSAPGGTTSGELKDQLGIVDGRKRISELVEMGFPITKVWEHGTNRFGETTRYIRYRIGAQDG